MGGTLADGVDAVRAAVCDQGGKVPGLEAETLVRGEAEGDAVEGRRVGFELVDGLHPESHQLFNLSTSRWASSNPFLTAFPRTASGPSTALNSSTALLKM